MAIIRRSSPGGRGSGTGVQQHIRRCTQHGCRRVPQQQGEATATTQTFRHIPAFPTREYEQSVCFCSCFMQARVPSCGGFIFPSGQSTNWNSSEKVHDAGIRFPYLVSFGRKLWSLRDVSMKNASVPRCLSQAHNEYVMAEKRREEWELKNHREGEILEMVEIFEVWL